MNFEGPGSLALERPRLAGGRLARFILDCIPARKGGRGRLASRPPRRPKCLKTMREGKSGLSDGKGKRIDAWAFALTTRLPG